MAEEKAVFAPLKLLRRSDGDEFERIVMCELLIPDVPNSFGDVSTREGIREFALQFALQGFGLDVNHDEIDVKNKDLALVEFFIARPGDPDFIEGSLVVGMKVLSDDIWQKVLDGELNGFSYQAEVYMLPVLIQNLRNRQVSGTTEPDLIDGHTHTYLVILNAKNEPIQGGTGITDGHSHRIVSHTITGAADTSGGRGHVHRYQVLINDEGETNVAGTL